MRINHQNNIIVPEGGTLTVSGNISASAPTADGHVTTRAFVLDNIDYGEIYINDGGRILADSIAVSGAITETGSASDTHTINGIFHTVTLTGAGFDARYTFTGLASDPNKINILGHQESTPAITDMEVQIWNWVHSRWDDLLAASTDLDDRTAQGTDTLYTFTITDELSAASDYLGTGGNEGEAIIRISTATGTSTDFLQIDYINIIEETIGMSVAGTYYTLTSGIVSGHSKTTTTNAPSGEIIFGHTGKYFVTGSTSFLGTGSVVVEGAVYIEGVIQDNIRFTRNINSTGDIGSASCQGFVDVTAGDKMTFRYSSNTSDTYVSVEHFNLTCNYRGA